MFTGHFAVALAGAGTARALPLWLLIAAAFGGDLTEAGVALFRINDPTRVWSHSIPATATLGAVLGGGWKLAGGTWREAAVLFAAAASHSALDFVTASKEFVPGAPRIGLNLYAHPFADGVLEGAMGFAGWAIWRRALPAGQRASTPSRLMLGTLVAAQVVATVSLAYWGANLATEGLSKFIR